MRGVIASRGKELSLKEAIVGAKGDLAWKAFIEYYNVLVRDKAALTNNVLDNSYEKLARGMAVTYLCGNLGVIIKQTSSYPRFLAYAGATHMASSIGQFTANPKAFLNHVFELDPQLKDRHGNVMIRALQESGAISGVVSGGMDIISEVDRVVAAIGWKATFDANMDRRRSVEESIREAQRAVLLTQQAAHAKDMPLVWRQRGMAKLIMIFTSEAAATLGMTTYDMVQAFRRDGLFSIHGFSTIIALTLSAGMFKLMTDGPPDDDEDETWLEWFVSATAKQAVESIPIFGKSLMIAFDAEFLGNRQRTQYDAFTSPFANIFRSAREVRDYITGDGEVDTERAIWSAVEAAGLMTGKLPVIGARRVYNSGKAALNGEVDYALLNMFGLQRWLRER